MNKILIILATTLLFTLTTNAQRFFFLGEKSYPSTKTFKLQSNSDDSDIKDLNITFAKEGASFIIIVSTKTVSTVRIKEKLIIYLEDGSVISCIDKGINDNVDDIASSAYYLTADELIKLKNSNITTIRYVLKCATCLMSPLEGIYSASNKGDSRTEFPVILKEFYK